MQFARLLSWSGAFCGGFVIFSLLTVRAPVNPPVVASRTIEAQLEIPPQVMSIFRRSCADCHSNITRWPWYSQIPPANWMVSRDVHEARSRMNLSEWPDPAAKPFNASALLIASCAAVSSGKMPPGRYAILHPGSKVTQSEAEQICAWSNQEVVRIGVRRRRQAAQASDGTTDAENRAVPEAGGSRQRAPFSAR